MVHHFEGIMMEDQGDRSQEISRITRLIPRLVTQDHNEMLVKPIYMHEVEEAMNEVTLGKAPRRDGFISFFFISFAT